MGHDARGYFAGCRCDDCRADYARYARDKRRRKYYGQKADTDLVPAQPAIIMVRYFCVKLGVSGSRFANVAGISRDAVNDLRQGDRTHVTRRISDAVLGVDGYALLQSQSDRLRPAAPYREYIMRLHAAGWSRRRLQSMTTVDLGVASVGRKVVTVANATEIEKLFEQIGDQIGPDRLSALRMQKRGWQPPAAYEETYRELIAAAMYKERPM